MNVQARYWQCFADLKRDATYVDLYQRSTEQIDRAINVFLAVTSSSSIAAWAVWQQHQLVWSSLIAASQVLQAVKSYIPYAKRLKSLAALSPELNALAITAEGDWFKISRGQVTEDDINSMHMRLKKKIHDLVRKHFPGSSLPESTRLEKRADQITVAYLATYFGGGDDERARPGEADTAGGEHGAAEQIGKGADASDQEQTAGNQNVDKGATQAAE